MIYFVYYTTWLLELFALITSFAFFRKYKKSKSLRFILPYLLIVVGAETFFQFTNKPSVVVYNVTMPIENIFYLFLFFSHIHSMTGKKIMYCIFTLYFIVLTFNYYMLTSFTTELVTKAYIVGAVFTIISYLLYLFELLKSESYLPLSRSLFFWIANGIFVFLCLTILKENINNYSTRFSMNVLITLKYIQFFASDVLYLSYIIGFIRCRTLK